MMKFSRCDIKYDVASLFIFALSLPVVLCAAVPVVPDVGDTNSQFTSEVGKETYEEVATPSAATVFLWDFSKETVYTYTYEQEVHSKADMGSPFSGKSGDMGQEMFTKGLLLIKSHGDGIAEFVLKDMKTSMKINTGEGKEPKTMEQAMPPFVVQEMKEDGSGSFGNSSQDMLLKRLFLLPPPPLKIGEFVDVPSQMPFNAMGSMLQVNGRSRITLTRYVKIGKLICAQLDVDTDMSEIKVPSGLKGKYTCSTKGKSVFYFDIANRSFVLGTVAFVMQFSIDAPMPQMKISGENPPDIPKRSKMSMVSDNLIRVKLKD